MPVKFRCENCNAKLKIALFKVGTHVKCPRCQHGQIVPSVSSIGNRSGVQVPQSRVATKESSENTDEKSTAKSLQRAETSKEAKDANDVRDAEKKAAGHEAATRPERKSGTKAADGEIATDQSVETNTFAEIHIETDSETEPSKSFAQFAINDEPALAINENQPIRSAGRIDYDRLSIPRRVVYLQGALLGLASLFFFTLGWWLGSSGQGPSAAADKTTRVSGGIYRTTNRGQAPDDGSVVIFLPADRRPQQRPDASQLMPGNVLTSQNDSVRIIREIGGEVGSVSSDGNFEFRLEADQTYYLCVLSNHHKSSKEHNSELTKRLRAEIGTWFLPLESLTETHAFRWQHVQLTGRQKAISNIVF